MPEKLARSVVVTPCCRHHSLTERPLLRHSWICVAHSCSSARCFNSALVILTPHNTTVAKPFATFRYYCLMCVYARLGLTVTLLENVRQRQQSYFSAILCLKQSLCKSAFREYEVMVIQTLAKSRCILSHVCPAAACFDGYHYLCNRYFLVI